jgi:hypothetical protein
MSRDPAAALSAQGTLEFGQNAKAPADAVIGIVLRPQRQDPRQLDAPVVVRRCTPFAHCAGGLR